MTEDQNYMKQCRSFEGGKPLYVHKDTLACAEQGCIACCYKIVVQPYLSGKNQTDFKPNVRPEQCLRFNK